MEHGSKRPSVRDENPSGSSNAAGCDADDDRQESFKDFSSIKVQGNTSHVDLPLFRFELFQRDVQRLLNVFARDFKEGHSSLEHTHRVELFLALMCRRKLYDDIVSYTSKHREGIAGMVRRCSDSMCREEDVRPIVCGMAATYYAGRDAQQHQQQMKDRPGLESVVKTTTARCAMLIQLCGMMKMLLPELYNEIEPILKGVSETDQDLERAQCMSKNS